jgi:hypothetical protein
VADAADPAEFDFGRGEDRVTIEPADDFSRDGKAHGSSIPRSVRGRAMAYVYKGQTSLQFKEA